MRVIAHRGASGYAPENTMASFRLAVAMGARAIELDVHMTKDGRLIVAHDDDFKRCAGLRRSVKSMAWAQASRLDVGKWFGPKFKGQRPPSLEQVYRFLPKRIELHVEIKHGSDVYPGIEARVLRVVARNGARSRTLISSFDHAALGRVRSLDAKARIGYLLGATKLKNAWRDMSRLEAESLNLSRRQVTLSTVRAAHRQGRKVLVYTVNTPEDRDRLAKMKVDGIFSNYPELLRCR